MRPAVSVIVPFTGDTRQLTAVAAVVGGLRLAGGDEVLIADNAGLAPPRALPPRVTVVPATGVRAPGFARNRAASRATGEWLVFLDADAIPEAGLLDAYFSPPPASGTALLAGAIRDRPGGSGRAARHAVARLQMRETTTLQRAGRPYAQTANCAVRASAFAAIGGFDEDARWGEDADLSFRLADAGGGLEHRPGAVAEHVSRPTLGGLLAQLSGHGAGAAWLQRRYPGQFPAPSAAALLRRTASATRDAGAALARRDIAEARAAGLALLEMAAFESGRLRSNRPRRSRGPG